MDNSLKLNQEIGERIRKARQAMNMSQQELSAKANISLPHISEIENGKKSMKLQTFIRIIEVLQVSADSIIRADVPGINLLYQSEFSEMISDCSPKEIEALKKIIPELKQTMRSGKASD